MTLAPHETQRFYRLWWMLLSFVNDHLRLVPSFAPDPGDNSVDPNDSFQIRNALWKNDPLRERFVQENPFGLGVEDLALVASWGRRVEGRFVIYKYLKTHTVVMGTRGAYGVLGLVSPIEDLLYQPPPVSAEMVLIPFEDRITYDSLLSPYNIYYGPGIRHSLADEYRKVRERGGVTTSLLPPEATPPEETERRLRAGNALLLKDFRKDLVGLSPKRAEEHFANVEALAGMLLQRIPPRPLADADPDDLLECLKLRGPGSRVSLKRFARFMEQSGRVEWGTFRGADLSG